MFPLLKGSHFGKRGASPPIRVNLDTADVCRSNEVVEPTIEDALVLILADYLVEDLPVQSTVFGWSKRAMKRYDGIRKITDEAWSEGW